MTKTVRTLSPSELTRAADDLIASVVESGFTPDALIGIETGGLKVVEALSKPPPIVLRCRMVRSTTEVKKLTVAARVLRRLPYPVADRLRLLEDWLGSRQTPGIPPPTRELEDAVDVIAGVVDELGLKRLLLVDDAVDSGGTLGCVLAALRARMPDDVKVLSAVLTRTRPVQNTAVEPDFTLHSMVLLRFPWSFDYRTRA